MFLLDYLFSIVGVLLGVAFFTLMERKFMGLAHYRKGPSKVIISGLSQPISDALKLLTKESVKMSSYKVVMFMAGPCVGLILMMVCWGWYEFSFSVNSTNLKIMGILATMSLSAYAFILMSWGSNSKYSMLGGHRAIAQVISYEVCLALFLMVAFYLSKNYSLENLGLMQQNMWVGVAAPPLLLSWVMLCMGESNRTPFDTVEGESEIVSGFNIEYGGGAFALIFISEYGMIMFLSFMSAVVFLGGGALLMKTFMVCFLFVWVRCSFPRVRYDLLMMTTWKMALPYSLAMVLAAVSLI